MCISHSTQTWIANISRCINTLKPFIITREGCLNVVCVKLLLLKEKIQKAKTFTFLQECMKAERSFITKQNVSLVTGLELGIKVRGGASCRRLGPALRPPVVPGCEAPGFYRFCRVKMKFKNTDCCDISSRDNT